MNKVTRTVLITLAAIVLVAAVLIFSMEREAPNTDVLTCATRTAVEDFIEANKIKQYALDDASCIFNSLVVLDKEASVEVSFSEETVSRISAVWELFDGHMAHAAADQGEEDDVVNADPYEFTQAEKDEVRASFDALREKLEERLGAKLEQYDILPVYEGAVLEDTEDQFYQGTHIREYSVRDKAGTLWILRFEACSGVVKASLVKLLDETGYEGFLPVVDLTKT